MNPYIQYMYSYPHKTAYRPLEAVNLRDYAERLQGPGHGLYLHIPFCQGKCGYCNLFSVTGANDEDMEHYLDTLERQMGQYGQALEPENTSFSDFTIGGGTPLLLTKKQLDRLFSMINRYLNMEAGCNIVIETAPNQTDRERLQILKEAGASRVSMGIQSFCREELNTLKRGHHPDKARMALDLLMSFEFPCVNLDFIYGIPGQGTTSLLKSLEEAVTYEPHEIFLYPLYVKHGARLEREGMVLEPEKAYEQYQEASSYLKANGFRQDSMRRFVRRRKREDRRGFSDCGFSSSLALGCGGRSYVGNLHFCTPYAITPGDCMRELKTFQETTDFTRITHGIFLSEDEEKRRYVIRHLLIRPGINQDRYQERFKSRLLEDFPLITQWMKEGYAVMEKGNYLALTKNGMGLSDYLGPQLISDKVSRRMGEWEDAHGLKKWAYGSLQGQPEKL